MNDPAYRSVFVYFRQPTERGEKAARGGCSARVEPTPQGEGPEKEVNRASGQGEPDALNAAIGPNSFLRSPTFTVCLTSLFLSIFVSFIFRYLMIFTITTYYF